ncbi:predicted protein [Uncinocarpus reesii 1704]|uniref:UBA domain-containing protein n=1 Tax=Uncinocarpus reesii (strain UAMH 1704) TaxID=336963 RepID=C4JLS8_UNCRE|nr:uncharacterized protein UREG_03786 [Uncinocarpus reesii 1704]EEP78940.1 predicted protein [Uncinocarpus reesii 1704]
MEAVINTAELLESVLLQVEIRTLLVSAQRVCRQWHALINDSPNLQMTLFLRPVRSADNTHYAVNPLLEEKFPFFFDGDNNGFEGHSDDLFDSLALVKNRDAFFRKGSSWRRMLVTQPPVRSLGLLTDTQFLHGSSTTWKLLEFDRPPVQTGDEGIEKRPEHARAYSDGLRMRTLYDEVVKTRKSSCDGLFFLFWHGRLPIPDDEPVDSRLLEVFSKAVKRSEVVLYTSHILMCRPKGFGDYGNRWERFEYKESDGDHDPPVARLIANVAKPCIITLVNCRKQHITPNSPRSHPIRTDIDDTTGLKYTDCQKLQLIPLIPRLLNPRSTVRSPPAIHSMPPSKAPTPANDSFANLVAFGSGASGKGVSLAERQRQLAQQKALEEKQRRAQFDAQYGGNNEQFWDNLGKSGVSSHTSGLTSGRSAQSSSPDLLSQGLAGSGLPHRRSAMDDDEDDILAAFNASAPVDRSTNFPIPSSIAPPAPNPGLHLPARNTVVMEDDDPFGLGEMSQRQTQPKVTSPYAVDGDDDDILGPLAKPVSEFAKPTPEITTLERQSEVRLAEDKSGSPARISPVDRAIAELVDMGFLIEKASTALATTESGTDVQAAVGWLLNSAHAEAQEKARGRSQSAQAQSRSERAPNGRRDRLAGELRDSSLPTQVRDQARFEERSPNSRRAAEKDPAQLAAEFGNNLFKSANSLWKSGTKRVQQAVQEFNSTPDPSQPRWMREERMEGRSQTEVRPQRGGSAAKPSVSVTDEALMLEMERAPPSKPPRPSRSPQPPPQHTGRQNPLRDVPPSHQLPIRPRRSQQDIQSPPLNDSRSRLSRLAADEQASEAYVSPARRRKTTPKLSAEPALDLLEGTTKPSQPLRAAASPSPARTPSRPTASPPIAPRPKVSPRQIPPVSNSTLLASHKHRQDGAAAFKRGDYAAAHVAYSTAISLIPGDHPVAIILLTNHALTALKIGEPKTAISDADRALSIIGPSRGESEKIDLANGEPMKEMREFFGKAMMRKAEALEQLERWTDAAKIWRETVESGHGGSASIQGRTRCEKAAGIRTPSAAAPRPSVSARPPPRATPRPAARSQSAIPAKPAEAVSRLRAANEAADRLDNEKFALADTVEARLTAWKGGKQDNLRALLASLDSVLWPETGWKKLGMAELVLPNKVKIHYMKGIAKVHPDKVRWLLMLVSS